jgi:tRNA G37 N-methylase TrmD
VKNLGLSKSSSLLIIALAMSVSACSPAIRNELKSLSSTGATGSILNNTPNYSDKFAYSTNVPENTSANATALISGNLFVAGFALDSSNTSHWLVREYSSGIGSIIDDYQYASGTIAQANALATDSSGNLYAAGYGTDTSGLNHWVVRKYSAGSWSTVDDYIYPGALATQPFALTTDSSGNIYAAGFSVDSSSITHWLVRMYSAGSWSTIDDYQYTPGHNANARAVTVDSSGNVYAAGQGLDGSSTEHWVVRMYSGGIWSTIDDYNYPSGMYPSVMALTADSSGNVYAAGTILDGSLVAHLVVREYSGGSWSTIDDYTYIGPQGAKATALTSDSLGNIYEGGAGMGASNTWVVREYSGGSWTTLDTLPVGMNGQPSSISADSSGNVYAAGYGNSPSDINYWLVRKYSGGSATTLDNYQRPTSKSTASALAKDSAGNLYAAGDGVDASNLTHWIVRKYSAGSWSTIDDFQYGAGYSTSVSALMTDSAGNLYAAGYGISGSNAADYHWIVREYSGGVWSTVDDFQYPSGYESEANALTIDSLGNLYAAGIALDSSFEAHWLVREYSGGSWSTIDDYQYDPGAGFQFTTSPAALTTDSSGNVYAAGIGVDGSYREHWVVREYSGGSWSTIDDYQGPTGSSAQALALTADTSGNIYASGTGYSASASGWVWIVRKYSGGSWTTMDTYEYNPGSFAQASALTMDTSGNLYASGYGKDSSSVVHWVVREYSGGSWSSLHDYQLDSGYGAQSTALVYLPSSDKVVCSGSAYDSAGDDFWITQAVP